MQQNNIKIIQHRLRETLAGLPYKVGVTMLAYTADRFKYQNWIDTYPEAWAKRKAKPWKNKGKVRNDAGRGLLTLSGRLRRGNRIVNVTRNSVTVGNDTPWARVHNEGLRVNTVQHVRQHTRMNPRGNRIGAIKGKEGKRSTRVKFGLVSSGMSVVKAHYRHMNYKMPARRFMGNSQYLNKQINRLITAEINKTFRP